ncbi:hypothetical protein GCM10010508_22890 [Streptomyces naganishii JCM 4654]|uniref:Uncharacterized protein n=1 Tax=Streptomyces naganishii JCM 4654 TaxID=1306179 RepID=A0A918Y1X6_9ACTN|nr:hypothetical protein GCM10010508_22890 [Streptomyces naganishii JCM 4654]
MHIVTIVPPILRFRDVCRRTTARSRGPGGPLTVSRPRKTPLHGGFRIADDACMSTTGDESRRALVAHTGVVP